MFLSFIRDVIESLQEFGDERFLKETDYADLCTTIAFKIAKEKKSDPKKVAEEILSKIEPKGYVGKVENVNGYINFFANEEFLKETIKAANKEDYGYIGCKGDILIEHTSANPDGPLHIGHIRNAIIGDTLARIFKKAGFNVRTHYYVNDMGRQMAVTVFGMRRFSLSNKKPDHAVADAYIAANKLLESNAEYEKEIEDLMIRYEKRDESVVAEFRKVIKKALEGINETMKSLNVEHDEFIWESDFIQNGYVERILRTLDEKGVVKKNGAWIVEIEGLKEVVLKRENGTTLYITRDLAYHLWKNENFSRFINVLGADHKLYAAQLSKLLEMLGLKKPEVVFFEFVSLPEGRMSTRKGRFISADDLIEKVLEEARKLVKKDLEDVEKVAKAVAIGAIRFDFVKVAPEKPMVFDLSKALDFERQTASYIQYTYARASSILRKGGERGDFRAELCNKLERDVVITISKFPAYIKKVVEDLKQNAFAEYLLNLASKFNDFYQQYPVLKAEDEVRRHRLAIVEAVRSTLKNGLDLLGIEALEKM